MLSHGKTAGTEGRRSAEPGSPQMRQGERSRKRKRRRSGTGPGLRRVLAQENKKLHQESRRLKQQNRSLEKKVAALEQENAELRKKLEEMSRAGKRQAAPFSRNKPKANPKRPGRPAGHPPAHRRPPRPRDVTETLSAPIPQGHTCTDCGGQLNVRTETQYVEDLPPVKPTVTKFEIEVGCCEGCGKRFQGRHPHQTSDALGAAAAQVGPRALGVAVEMKYRIGTPFAKISELLDSVAGLYVSAGGLARACARAAEALEIIYDYILEEIRCSDTQFVDETGWREDGKACWLWVFASKTGTGYVVRPSRGIDVIAEILEEPTGTLHCDGLKTYEGVPGKQQTCLRHIIEDLKKLVDTKKRCPEAKFLRTWLAILRKALDLPKRLPDMTGRGYTTSASRLKNEMARSVGFEQDEAKPFKDPDVARMARRLHRNRHRLFGFLDDLELEGTNNRSEREIRFAVIVRKISAGTKSPKGTRTFEILASVLRTCRIRGINFHDLFVEAMRDPAPESVLRAFQRACARARSP